MAVKGVSGPRDCAIPENVLTPTSYFCYIPYNTLKYTNSLHSIAQHKNNFMEKARLTNKSYATCLCQWQTVTLNLRNSMKINNLPIAMAVFPVPGCPAIKTARPAIFPS